MRDRARGPRREKVRFSRTSAAYASKVPSSTIVADLAEPASYSEYAYDDIAAAFPFAPTSLFPTFVCFTQGAFGALRRYHHLGQAEATVWLETNRDLLLAQKAFTAHLTGLVPPPEPVVITVARHLKDQKKAKAKRRRCC